MIKFCLAILLAPACLLASEAGAPQLVALPGLKAKFSFQAEQALKPETRFDLDADGKPWVLANPHLILLSGSGVSSRESLRDILFDGKRLLGASDTALGVLKAGAKKQPRVKLGERILLDESGWSLARGGEQGALAYGLNSKTGQTQIIRLRDRKTLLHWPERVLAITAGPEGLYFATPSGLKQVDAQGQAKAVECGGLKPHSLAWVEGTGLALAAGEEVWLQRQGKLWPLLKARATLLRSHGNVLHALVPSQGGIIQIQGWRDWPATR